ncbi:hypothetical protein K0M31_015889 [Melipona bicolor]|uniref:Uncharacterized protein n=1 Tax=Melipona bicolor TaxID=60889 RepID=A0AA40KT01_9HYME|nr:hypothetical protein K0M31_015889 [Melipona bicolor]
MPWTEYDLHDVHKLFSNKEPSASAPRRTPTIFFAFASASLVADVPERYNGEKKRKNSKRDSGENTTERRNTRNIIGGESRRKERQVTVRIVRVMYLLNVK